MEEQETEILTGNRSSYAWLGVIVVLAVGAGAWFIPKMAQPLMGWLVIAIICLPASLVFLLGTFTRYFDLKLSEKGVSFGGYSGPRKFTWQEIIDVTTSGDDQNRHVSISLTPVFKDEVEYHRPSEVLPKLYGLTPEGLEAKLKHWKELAQTNSIPESIPESESTSLDPESEGASETVPATRTKRLLKGIFFIVLSLWVLAGIRKEPILGLGSEISDYPPFNIILMI